VFSDGIVVVPFSAPDQGARIANLLGAAKSPLRDLIQAAARETTLAPATPADTGKLDELKKSLGAKLGQPAAAAQAAPDTDPVDVHFQALHDLAGASLDEPIAALKDAAATLEATDSARKQSLPPPPTTSLDKLKLLAQGAPAPLASVLDGVAGNADSSRVRGEHARLSAMWAASVAPLCRQALDGRYPFVRASARDATADDFARVLAPGGLIDDFFQKNLQNSVDMTGAQWRWRPQGRSLGISDDVLAQFQRAAQIRDAMFRDGGRDISVRFSAKMLTLDPSVKRFVLDDPQFGDTPAERRQLLFGGGLRIQTTLDLDEQAKAERAVESVRPPAPGPDAAACRAYLDVAQRALNCATAEEVRALLPELEI